MVAEILLGLVLVAFAVLLAYKAFAIAAERRKPTPPKKTWSPDPAWLEKEAKRQAKEKRKIESGKRVYLSDREGLDWNPMRSYPRNLPCACGSGKKFKRCCRDKMGELIPVERVPNAKRVVEMARAGIDVPAMVAKAERQAQAQAAK